MELTEKLRELAADLRKLAADWDSPDSQNPELDLEKVRDFLLFYGGGAKHARHTVPA